MHLNWKSLPYHSKFNNQCVQNPTDTRHSIIKYTAIDFSTIRELMSGPPVSGSTTKVKISAGGFRDSFNSHPCILSCSYWCRGGRARTAPWSSSPGPLSWTPCPAACGSTIEKKQVRKVSVNFLRNVRNELFEFFDGSNHDWKYFNLSRSFCLHLATHVLNYYWFFL